MKKIIVAGNWKMNKTYLEAKSFINSLNTNEIGDVPIILGVPMIYGDTLFQISKKENVNIVPQNCSEHDAGAYTGEVSAKMIASLDMKYCVVGHSERRQYFHETDEIVCEKIKQLLQYRISPIFCIGEILEERENGKTFEKIESQLKRGLDGISTEDINKIIIAYEPVWAIGTGKTATKEQAQEVHKYIHNYLKENYSQSSADTVPILYGGSCNENNAEELFSQENIDGGLIGGASLVFEKFHKIINIAEKLNSGQA